MAATYLRRTRPPAPKKDQYDGISQDPPSTVRIRRPTSRDAILQGSVASRVKLIQSHTEPLLETRGSPPPIRPREDTRAGFGRRLSRRFGNPAIQSAQPGEESGVESRHSYLGLHTVRKNHEEEHASADSAIQYHRSPGISGLIDQSTDERQQYDAVSPWGTLPRTKPNRTVNHRSHSPDLDVLKEIDSSGNQTRHMAQTSIFPSTAVKDYAGMYSNRIKPRRAKFIDSEASIATTSTIRRQSVRDLFDDYGIPRPAGLASREVSQEIGEPTHTAAPRIFCHLCSWSNSCTSLKCWSCRHPLCNQCKDYPSQLPTTQEEETSDHEISVKKRHEFHKSIPKPKENRVEYDPMKQYQPRPGPTPIQSRKGTRKPSSPPITFPDFYDPPNSQKSPRKMPPLHFNRQEQRPVYVLSGHRTRTSVKDSPFLIADSVSPIQTHRVAPADMREETHHTVHNHHKHHSQHQRLIKYPSTVPSGSVSCESTTYRVTHHGHQPAYHASPCPTKKPRQRVPECTENGYIADTSRVDDAVNSQSTCNSRVSRPDPHLAQHSGSGCSHFTCTSMPSSHHSQIMKTDYSANHDIPEYVECHGYPRTGHARHGSPVSAGIVGECQHCLDDCQCAACQNTHHSVRCCVHTDHQTIVHHHHTPQKIVTVECSEEHVLPDFEKAPLRAHKPPTLQSHSSNAHHQYGVEMHAKRSYGSEEQAHFQEVPKSPSPPPPPIPKPSSLWKEAIKADRETKEAKLTKVEKTIETVAQAEPPAKGNSPPIQRESPEHSSLDTSAEPTDGTWFTIPSQHDHDHIHERRNSCPPSKKQSLDKHPQESEMTGALSPRTQTTRPESEQATRKLSTVQALKQQLLSHREELQRIQKDCAEQINIPAHSGVAELANRIERRATIEEPYKVARTVSVASKGSSSSKKRNWKLKLVDWSPGGKKKPGEEHRLSDDEIVSEDNSRTESYKAMPSVSTATADNGNWMDFNSDSETGSRITPGKEHTLSIDQVELETYEKAMERKKLEREQEHDCVWKQRFEEVSKDKREKSGEKDLGILGVTVLVHLKGRMDLVARAENWTGGELKEV